MKLKKLFNIFGGFSTCGENHLQQARHGLVDGIAITSGDLLADLEMLVRPVREILLAQMAQALRWDDESADAQDGSGSEEDDGDGNPLIWNWDFPPCALS